MGLRSPLQHAVDRFVRLISVSFCYVSCFNKDKAEFPLKGSANVLFSKISQRELCACRVHHGAKVGDRDERGGGALLFYFSSYRTTAGKERVGSKVLLLCCIFSPFRLCAVCF